ncbi:hypothetical protein BJX65DRAFT_144726 [Aspergillus insuetus]
MSPIPQNRSTNKLRFRFAHTNPLRIKKRGVDREGDCQMTGTPFIYPRKLWIQMQQEIEKEAILKQRQMQQQTELEKQLDQIINETLSSNQINNGFGSPINNGFVNPFPQGYGLPIVNDLNDTPMPDVPQNHANYNRYNIRHFSRAARLHNNLGCRGRRGGPRHDNN